MNRGGKGVQRAGVIEGEGAVVQRAGTSLLTSPPPTHTHTNTTMPHLSPAQPGRTLHLQGRLAAVDGTVLVADLWGEGGLIGGQMVEGRWCSRCLWCTTHMHLPVSCTAPCAPTWQ